ncbi:two-component system sensor histidine kinase UhpB [Mesorhizobium sp. J18]|nr:two-component system sensor histidine kinase UhpB [Mesorhizobium sp. J18]
MAGIAVDHPNTVLHDTPGQSIRVERAIPRSKDLAGRLWHRISLRRQILTAFLLVNLAAGIVAAIVVIYDARQAAQEEITASMHLAGRLVREAVGRSSADNGGIALFRDLGLELGHLRHVRILFADGNGSLAPLLPAETVGAAADDKAGVPDWFTALINVGDIRREMKIVLNGHQIGSVVMIGHAADEIAEVWRDTKHLAIIALTLNAAVLAILYIALGRVLHPLTKLAAGLRELEQGQFQHRLAQPRVRELADISDRFNALASRLGAANADNIRLTKRLISVQDDERRQIATELHDEIGPCLFGMKANVASLEQLAGELPDATADRLRDRVATLTEITEKIQILNRRLLGKIRPMALGHVPLADIISGVVADFERFNPKVRITLAVGRLADSYGDSVDLTVYRCLQEGITNAERHGEATMIAVDLTERPYNTEDGGGSQASPVLRLSIRDDGHGVTPGVSWGLGLTGMDERVRALGGMLTLTSQPGAGTCLDISIPIDELSRIPDGRKGQRRSRQ